MFERHLLEVLDRDAAAQRPPPSAHAPWACFLSGVVVGACAAFVLRTLPKNLPPPEAADEDE